MIVNGRLIPFYDERGFDTLVCDESRGMFAVFDGMGTSEEARFASTYAKEYLQTTPFCSYETLKVHLERISNYLGQKQVIGTTATIVTVDPVSNALNYVHIGDSRLYILKKVRVKQITADEGVENILYNYVGQHGKGVCQLGYIEDEDWDRFMICSDGVTGDRKPDLVADYTVETALRYSDTPEIAIDLLLKASTKQDDKSIIVGFKS